MCVVALILSVQFADDLEDRFINWLKLLLLDYIGELFNCASKSELID